MNELSGNVYENKGPLLKTWTQSGNVIENTCSYTLKAGMLLKRKGVSASATPSSARRAARAQGIAADHFFAGGKSRRCFRTSPASGAAGESCK